MGLTFDHKPEWRRFIERGNRDDVWDNTLINPFPSDRDTATAWIRGSINEYACPFAWLLDEVIHPIFE